jgi:hypothetical protein
MIVVFKTGRSPSTIGLTAASNGCPTVLDRQLKRAADI